MRPRALFPHPIGCLHYAVDNSPRRLKNIPPRRFSIIKKTAVTGFLRHLHLPTCSGRMFFSYSLIVHKSFTFFRNYGTYSGLLNHKTNLQCWRTKVSARSILYMHPSTFFQSCRCNIMKTLLLHWFLGVITTNFTLKVFKATIVLIRTATLCYCLEIDCLYMTNCFVVVCTQYTDGNQPLVFNASCDVRGRHKTIWIYMTMHNVSLCKWSHFWCVLVSFCVSPTSSYAKYYCGPCRCWAQ